MAAVGGIRVGKKKEAVGGGATLCGKKAEGTGGGIKKKERKL